MKKKKVAIDKMVLNKTRISNFNIQGGIMDSSVSFIVACPVPEPTSLTCKPTHYCTSWRPTQCDHGPCTN